MLRTFSIIDGKLTETSLPEERVKEHIAAADWVDIQDATEKERLLIESLNISNTLPDAEDVEEIESSARYFTNGGNIHIHSLFLHHAEGTVRTATVAFIVKEDQLLTFRDVELADFRLLRLRARNGFVNAQTPINIMVSLLEQKVEDLADAIEDIYKDLEIVSSGVLEENEEDLEDTIEVITRQEDENGKVRLCLMDTQRSVTYLQRHIHHHEKDYKICQEMLRDIESLTGHTQFLFDKVNFLMSAAQGFINIKQNQIIKALSVATVFFLPATLVASIYGMNFQFIPELHLQYGYFYALGFMALTAGLTYWFFRWKKLL
ncbi:MAG: magnesium/cobalt transporter CorA [Ostreibacterium sp.]